MQKEFAYPLILVRHAQSQHYVKGLTGGWTDTSLNDVGRKQAACVAERLAEELAGRPCSVWTSDLKRAAETATAIGNALGMKPIETADLRDINNGVAAGKSLEEAERLAHPPTEPIHDWQPYPEAESWRQLQTRMSACGERLLAEQDTPLVLVTHGHPIVCLVAWWLGLDDADDAVGVSFTAMPASISVLRVNEWGERTLERLNDTAHLRAKGLAEAADLAPWPTNRD